MDKRIVFFDSNVLVAASLQEHVHHAASNACLAPLLHGGGAMAAHSLAETYNTLTRFSIYRMPPSDASRVIQHASSTYKLVTLTAAETVKVIEEISMRGFTGPIVYDALLLACARKIDARVIYTSNVKHFRQVAPDLASIIREP